jgi:hypothetical protein
MSLRIFTLKVPSKDIISFSIGNANTKAIFRFMMHANLILTERDLISSKQIAVMITTRKEI